MIDVNTDVELNQWEGCHQLCNPQRGGTYMRVSETRYRWEFQLVDGETAADYQSLAAIEPLISAVAGRHPARRIGVGARRPPTRSAPKWPTAGATAMCSSWVTPHT